LSRRRAPGAASGRASASAPAELPPPRLLGAFDPVLLGWRSREALLDVNHQRIVTVNGIFRPFALVKGRAVATWTIAAGKVVLKPHTATPGGRT
jgi:hypothetical protein